MDLAPKKRLGCNQDSGPGETQADPDRLGTERGVQRAEHGSVLQRTKRGDVQIGDGFEQRGDPIAGTDAEPAQYVGKPARQLVELGIGKVVNRTVLCQKTQCDMVTERSLGMPVDGLVGDIQSPNREPIKLLGSSLPGECLDRSSVTGEIRRDSAPSGFFFTDNLPIHPS